MKQLQESLPVSHTHTHTHTRVPVWLRKWRWGLDGGPEAQDGAADIWAWGQSTVWNGHSALAALQLSTKVTADGVDAGNTAGVALYYLSADGTVCVVIVHHFYIFKSFHQRSAAAVWFRYSAGLETFVKRMKPKAALLLLTAPDESWQSWVERGEISVCTIQTAAPLMSRKNVHRYHPVVANFRDFSLDRWWTDCVATGEKSGSGKEM